MFDTGTHVYYKNLKGIINFVCEQYITITVSKGVHKSQDCNVLVYRSQYENVIPTNSK